MFAQSYDFRNFCSEVKHETNFKAKIIHLRLRQVIVTVVVVYAAVLVAVIVVVVVVGVVGVAVVVVSRLSKSTKYQKVSWSVQESFHFESIQENFFQLELKPCHETCEAC